MQITCVVLLLFGMLQVSEPPSQGKKVDQGAKAIKELDMQLSHILEGQQLLCRKIDYFHRMGIGGPLLDFLTPVPAWDWPEDLKKLDERIFGRWKKPPSKK